jgi:aryl-alcohol dehydrogenase-like predicted oxidoreductase
VRYRVLGHSGLQVSELTLGTMTFGDRDPAGPVSNTPLDAARQVIDVCLDAGVNLIDTADAYAAGRSEEIVGEALLGRRDHVLIATKARFAMGRGPNEQGLSRHHLIRACEASLRRLRTDHIDLYQVHEWDGLTPLEETLDALDTLVHQGKVRYIGCSNYSGWHLMKALGVSKELGVQRFVSQQIYYSLIGRDAESELIPAALDQNLGVLVWSPLAGGLLSGKYHRDEGGPAGARHSGSWGEPPISDWDAVYDVIDVVREIGRERGVSGAQVALSWLLDRPAVTSLVIGARTIKQLEDNLATVELTLTEEERARLDKASLPELRYPYWHQRATARSRLGLADQSLISQYP